MRSDRARLQDIQEAIADIEKYKNLGRNKFFENELIQSWMLLRLQIIGEAARSMSKDAYTLYPEISWTDIADFRNLLVHEYFRVDLSLVWKVIDEEIPQLKGQVASILEK